MNDTPQASSAGDAIRCGYLARVAEQEGHPEAARRWQEMAVRWHMQFEQRTNGNGRSATEETPAAQDGSVQQSVRQPPENGAQASASQSSVSASVDPGAAEVADRVVDSRPLR